MRDHTTNIVIIVAVVAIMALLAARSPATLSSAGLFVLGGLLGALNPTPRPLTPPPDPAAQPLGEH